MESNGQHAQLTKKRVTVFWSIIYVTENCVVTESAFTCRPRKPSVRDIRQRKDQFYTRMEKVRLSFCDLYGLDFGIVQLKVSLVFSSWCD